MIKGEELLKLKKTIENSKEFRELLKDEEKVRETMHRFFHFLSYPSDSFDLEVFTLLNSLQPPQNNDDLSNEFNRFSKNGQSINEDGFRNYIVHLVKSEQREV